MSRSSNQKRKRKARVATGVPCERWQRFYPADIVFTSNTYEDFSKSSPTALMEQIAADMLRGMAARFGITEEEVEADLARIGVN